MENRRKVVFSLLVSCLLLGTAVGCSDGDSPSPQMAISHGSVTSSAGATDTNVAGAETGETGGSSSVSTGYGGDVGVGGKSVGAGGSAGEGGEEEIAGGGNSAVAGETSVGVGGATGVGGVLVGNGGRTSTGVGGKTSTVVGVGGKTGNGGATGVGGATETGVGGATCAAYDELCTAQPCCAVDPDSERPLVCDVDVCVYADVVGVGGKTGNGGATGVGGKTGNGGTSAGVGGATEIGNGGTSVVGVGGAGVGGATVIGVGGTSVETGVGGATVVGVGGAGVGGAITCDPIPLAGPSGAVATPFECTGSWERDLALDALNDSREGDLTLTDDIQCFAGDECFLATSSYASGYVAHRQSGAWHLEETPAMNFVNAVHGTSASSVWVGGASASGGAALHLESGVWKDRSSGLKGGVVDIHAISASRAYAATFGMESEIDGEGRVLGTYARSRVYRWDGGSWTDTSAPSSRETRFMRFWVGSDESIIAVGMFTDTTTGLLFRWDGCQWTDFSNHLPSDVDSLNGVDVNSDGEVYVVGSLASGGGGIVLKSTNLVNWMRHGEPELESNRVVLSPRVGAAIVGGSLPIDGNPDWKGTVSVESEGAWMGAEPVAQEVEFVTGISVLGSTVHVSTMRGTGQAGVYTQTCQ